jgi:hypothetical protein
MCGASPVRLLTLQLRTAASAFVLHRLSQESAAAAVAGVEHELRVQHMKALTAAGQEAQQASEAAAQAWQEQQAALEKQHLQALLRVRQAHEQDRQQWKKERDESVQQLTAEYTASGMQVRWDFDLLPPNAVFLPRGGWSRSSS